jgi:hypothetical protein
MSSTAYESRGLSPSRRSATIIEIAIVVLILTVALPPLVSSFADSARQSIQPAQATVASFLVIERMEEIIARRYRGIQAGADSYDAITTANFPNETTISGFPGYQRTVTISEVTAALQASGSPVGYRKVRVTVTWNNGANAESIERIFADF